MTAIFSIPEEVTLTAFSKGSITLSGANVRVDGKVIVPGGAISLNAFDISPAVVFALRQSASSQAPPATTAGACCLGATSSLNAAGLLVDDNSGRIDQPRVLDGGCVDQQLFRCACTW